ncbi:MAG: nitroreductase family protein [Halanaerobiales bacterium]|nr:nitroreductase family protein [Halanaerobiales bacterium]
MNETLSLIKKRVSLRRYKDKDIEKNKLDKIINSAMRAPTAGNMMSYSIIVIKDPEKKELLSKTCDNQPFIKKAPVLLIFLADYQRLYDYFKICNLKEYCKDNELKFIKPNLASIFLGAGDAFIAAQNAVLAAEALDIGSCYIGDIVENYEIKKDLFDLPKYVLPVAMLSLGYYPDNYNKRISNRFDKKNIVFNEKYKRLDNRDLKEMYKDKESKLKENNKFGAENFGQYIYARKFNTEFYKEMNRSLEVMIKRWLKE